MLYREKVPCVHASLARKFLVHESNSCCPRLQFLAFSLDSIICLSRWALHVHQPCFIVMHKSVKSFPPSNVIVHSKLPNLHNSTHLINCLFSQVVSQQCFNWLFCGVIQFSFVLSFENTHLECDVFFPQSSVIYHWTDVQQHGIYLWIWWHEWSLTPDVRPDILAITHDVCLMSW